ncbi:MAG: right-handed parallel beta-helix repeat-containing protein, partial [Promethearchaeota archaeon]
MLKKRFSGKTINVLPLICLLAISTFIYMMYPTILTSTTSSVTFTTNNIKRSPYSSANHPPIVINGNNELAAFCTKGSGTVNDPYIIEDLIIDSATATGICIGNTNLYLIIRNCTIEDSTLSFTYFGIEIQNSQNIIIENNTINSNNDGILFHPSTSDIEIKNNTICHNGGVGIKIWGGKNFKITNNNISYNSEHGILTVQINSSIITNNNATYNKYSGIGISESNTTLVSENTVIGNCKTNNNAGILVSHSNEINVTSNIVSYNEYTGISFDRSNNNIAFKNLINNNKQDGMFVGISSSNNTIWDNKFENNVMSNARSFGGSDNTQWDNGNIGNYWDDY